MQPDVLKVCEMCYNNFRESETNAKYYDYGQVGKIQPSEEAASARMG